MRMANGNSEKNDLKSERDPTRGSSPDVEKQLAPQQIPQGDHVVFASLCLALSVSSFLQTSIDKSVSHLRVLNNFFYSQPTLEAYAPIGEVSLNNGMYVSPGLCFL